MWFLLLLACAERLAFLIGSRDRSWPFSVFYEGDAEAFYNYAQAILHGLPYDNGIPFHPPFFPLVLAGIHAIAGDPLPHGLIRGVLGVAGAAVPAMLYLLVRDLIGRGPALAAGLLATFSFGLDAIATSATSEGLYLILLLVLLLAARRDPATGRTGIARAALLGLGTALLGLTRAEGLLLGLSIAAVWIAPALRARPPRRWSPVAVAVAGGIIVGLAPWTIRNEVSLTHWNERVGRTIGVALPTFVPLTAYGPLNFALANNDAADGGFQRKLLTSKEETAVLDLADPQHRHYFLHGAREGARWIGSHPLRFASLAGRKLDITARSLDLGWSPWNGPLGRTGTRRPVDLFSPDPGGLRWVQLAIAIGGFAILLRRGNARRPALLLGLPILSVMLSSVLFFGYVRLGMLAVPFLFAFEGVAIAAVASRLPQGMREIAARPWVGRVLAGAAFVALVAAAFGQRDYRASGTAGRPGGTLLRDAPMRIEPLRR